MYACAFCVYYVRGLSVALDAYCRLIHKQTHIFLHHFPHIVISKALMIRTTSELHTHTRKKLPYIAHTNIGTCVQVERTRNGIHTAHHIKCTYPDATTSNHVRGPTWKSLCEQQTSNQQQQKRSRSTGNRSAGMLHLHMPTCMCSDRAISYKITIMNALGLIAYIDICMHRMVSTHGILVGVDMLEHWCVCTRNSQWTRNATHNMCDRMLLVSVLSYPTTREGNIYIYECSP